MKKGFFAVISAALLGALVFSGCQGTEDESVLTFGLEVSSVASTSAHAVITPSDETSTFYFDVISKEGFDNLSTEGVQTFIDSEVERRVESYEITKEEVLAKLLSKGVQEYDFTSLSPLSDYYLVAFAVSESGVAEGELAYEAFTTEPVNPSANVLDIQIGEVYNDGADYTVVPSVEEDTYVVDIWIKSLVDELGDSETINYFIEYNSFMMPFLSASGTYEFVNEDDGKVWQPGREYYVVAFGYDIESGEATTKLFKKELKTIGGDPATCEFTFNVDILDDDVTVKVIPSDKQVVYIWNVIDQTTFDKYKETYKTDEATLAYILNGNIEQQMEYDMCKRQQAVEALGRWSGYTSSDEEGADFEEFRNLPSNEKMIAWAVAVDAEGNPQGQFYTDTFETL